MDHPLRPLTGVGFFVWRHLTPRGPRHCGGSRNPDPPWGHNWPAQDDLSPSPNVGEGAGG